MMKKIIILFSVTILVSISSFCQIPMGKDIKDGIKEIKVFMLQSGYHFFREGQSYTKNIETNKWDVPSSYDILYKEEILISITKNLYDNVDLIVISCESNEIRNQLLEKLGLPSWEYLYSKNSWGDAYKCEYYKVNAFYSILTSDGKGINFVRSIPPPDK